MYSGKRQANITMGRTLTRFLPRTSSCGSRCGHGCRIGAWVFSFSKSFLDVLYLQYIHCLQTLSGGPKTALHAAITLKMQGTSRYLIMNLRKLSQRKDRGVNKNFWPERTTHYSPSWPRRVETVLPTAIRLAQSETTSLLLENGADPSTTDAAGVDMMSLCYDSACSDTSANVSKYANIATELLKYGWGKCSITNGAPFSVSAREVLDKILEEIEEPNFGSESNSRRPALADISNQPDQQTKRRKIDTEKTCTHGWAKFKKEVSKEYAWQRRKALLFARMKNRHR